MGRVETSADTSVTNPAITIVSTDDDVARLAADIVGDTLAANPRAVISLPTGSTPLKMYHELVRRQREGSLDLSQMQLFLLDEYLGQSIEDEASLTNWVNREFLVPAGLGPNVHFVPSTADDPDTAAAAYDRSVAAAGGLELAVLGLGPNGHIAFNEPGSPADSRTRVIDLTPETLDQSAAYWDGRAEIPNKAMTMGVGTLLEARRLVLIVTGESKAEILRQALEEPMSAEVPASWLRLAANRLEVIVDEAAASRLSARLRA